MRTRSLAVLSLGLALAACRGDDGGGGGDDTPMPDATVGGATTIFEVQCKDGPTDCMPVGTAVELEGVVVTAIDTYGNRTGDLWVQDPAGGEFSGVKVFGAPLDQVAALAVGDIVNITGAEKDEFALMTDDSGRKVTEIKASAAGMTVTKTGTGTVPTPPTVDAVALAAMTKEAREAEWEKWEGVLIEVVNARQLAATRTFGTNPGPDSNEFRITGIARVQSVLAELPSTAAFGVCYDSITGIGDYFFNDLVLPRAATDVVDGGTGCRPMAGSVVALQTGTNVEAVDVTDGYITARDDVGQDKGVWIADELAGAANNGVYVYLGRPATLDAMYAVGARVNLQGLAEERDTAPMGMTPMGDTVTQVSGPPTVTVVAAPASQTTPAMTASPATLADIGAAGEPWEGVLVRVTLMEVTASLGNGKYELTSNSGEKLVMDDDAYVIPTGQTPAVGTCYTAVTGVMNVQLIDNLRTLNPRSAADLVTGAGCN